MAISFTNIQKTYEAFHEIKKSVLPELNIKSFPEDMAEWTNEERKNPKENIVYGWGKKSDSGWESIAFFVKNPSEELKQKFDQLKSVIGNSSISEPYHLNPEIYCFGWF